MKFKSWTTLLGAIVGLVVPIIVLFTYYYIYFRANEFGEFINQLLHSTLFAPVLSLCVLVNLLVFFGFIWLNKDEGSMGVLLSTLLYACLVFGMKLF